MAVPPTPHRVSGPFGPGTPNPKESTKSWEESSRVVIFFFPYNPPPHPPYPDKPPARPTPKSLMSVPFGSVWLRFGSVWLRLAPFRVCFGSVSGPFRGVGWGRGGVGERGFCKGKEYHYSRATSPESPECAPQSPKTVSKDPKALSQNSREGGVAQMCRKLRACAKLPVFSSGA